MSLWNKTIYIEAKIVQVWAVVGAIAVVGGGIWFWSAAPSIPPAKPPNITTPTITSPTTTTYDSGCQARGGRMEGSTCVISSSPAAPPAQRPSWPPEFDTPEYKAMKNRQYERECNQSGGKWENDNCSYPSYPKQTENRPQEAPKVQKKAHVKHIPPPLPGDIECGNCLPGHFYAQPVQRPCGLFC
jgi:hypothetical protein